MPDAGAVHPINIMIPTPSYEKQREFAEAVQAMEAIIAQQDRMAAASEQMVDALMSKVFQGNA